MYSKPKEKGSYRGKASWGRWDKDPEINLSNGSQTSSLRESQDGTIGKHSSRSPEVQEKTSKFRMKMGQEPVTNETVKDFQGLYMGKGS